MDAYINKQISILEKLNLNISDKDFIEYILRKENFYYIVSEYKNPFIINDNSKKNKFINGTTIENIYALYEFDIDLKTIFFKYLIKIESILKSLIYYVFYENHGNINPLKHSNFSLNNDKMKNENLIFIHKKIFSKLTKEKENDISYYNNNYGHIPLWAIINILDLEELRKFYLIMKDDERDEVAKKIIEDKLLKTELDTYFNILVDLKYVCFDNLSIYNFQSKHKLIPCDLYFKYDYIPESVSNLFTLIIIFKFLLYKEDFKDMYKSIASNLDYLDNNLKNLRSQKLYERICEKFLGIPFGFFA